VPRAKKATQEAAVAVVEPEEVKVPEVVVKEFKARDVAPKAVRSVLLDIYEIKGWDGGDPPAQDFIADIRKFGVETPVRVVPNGDGYYIVDGRRRVKTVEHLSQTGDEKFAEGKIPAYIDTRKGREPGLASLAMNYQRGENVIGDSYTVKGYLDKGWDEKQIAEESGMSVAQVRVLRNIATRLDTRLVGATEQGKMSPWSARMAAQMKFPYQEMLVNDYLIPNGKITSDDIKEVQKIKRTGATANLPKTMFEGDNDDLPYEEDGEDGEPAGLPSSRLESKPKTGRVTVEMRRENYRHLLLQIQAEIGQIKKRNDTDKGVLQFVLESLALLDDTVAEPITVEEDEELAEDDVQANSDDENGEGVPFLKLHLSPEDAEEYDSFSDDDEEEEEEELEYEVVEGDEEPAF